MPWGDVTRKGNTWFLTVFEWPVSGELYLPNLDQGIKAARLLKGSDGTVVLWQRRGEHIVLRLPARAPEALASVIELQFSEKPEVDQTLVIDPEAATELPVEFATVDQMKLSEKRWMEKFGEWKRIVHAHEFADGGAVTWDVDVLEPGEYQVFLNYAGEGRIVWEVAVDGGEKIQNQQNSSHNYQSFPIGWLHFPAKGRHQITVRCLEGNQEKASLHTLELVPLR
jgi:alpha-L-fucosidase